MNDGYRGMGLPIEGWGEWIDVGFLFQLKVQEPLPPMHEGPARAGDSDCPKADGKGHQEKREGKNPIMPFHIPRKEGTPVNGGSYRREINNGLEKWPCKPPVQEIGCDKNQGNWNYEIPK